MLSSTRSAIAIELFSSTSIDLAADRGHGTHDRRLRLANEGVHRGSVRLGDLGDGQGCPPGVDRS